ncbi:hypothetical protein EYF80_065649 [Liparis tanakae]|uniref:Uncharacterized protein n=1 Tax=Liparis tanakae TaxID=230148 RepID=A0A4Z2E612_9TELE|nr:hypothetical protein EYF80_065649 [Liparis tanakae]
MMSSGNQSQQSQQDQDQDLDLVLVLDLDLDQDLVLCQTSTVFSSQKHGALLVFIRLQTKV